MNFNSGRSWSTAQECIILILVIFVVTTLIGNGLVIASWIFHKKTRTSSNFFLVSLSFTDICYTTISTPLTSTIVLHDGWIFGPVTCRFWVTASYIMFFVSANHLVLIAIDRYRVLAQGISYLQRRKPKDALLEILILWAAGCLLISPIYLDWKGTHKFIPANGTNPGICTWIRNSYFVGLTFLCSYTIPFTLQLAVYTCVFLKLRERFWQQAGGFNLRGVQDSESSGSTKETSKELTRDQVVVDCKKKLHTRKSETALMRERRAFFTLGFLILAYIISITPFVIMLFLDFVGVGIPSWYHYTVIVLMWTNMCVNPFIYAWRNTDFQEAFKFFHKKLTIKINVPC